VFPVTPAQWAHFLGGCGVRPTVAAAFAEPFAEECTPDRFRDPGRELDDYMAQILWESGMLRSLAEDLDSYSPARIRELGALFGPGSRWAKAAASADALAGDGPALAEVLYGGRFGNKRPGDGYLFRGQGLPQITFYDNFAWLGDLMGQDLTVSPQLLQQPRYAVQASLLWFRGKVPLAYIDHDDRVRRCVNGSTLGLENTRKLAALARANLPQESAA
jgi:putative chitinase